MQADLVLADIQLIAVVQLLARDALLVDIDTVGALQVFNGHLTIGAVQQRMFAADGEVADHDVVVGPAPERGALLGQRDFLDDGAIN
ncbi:hypothetical protein D3C71_2043990 [compost metagenome]